MHCRAFVASAANRIFLRGSTVPLWRFSCLFISSVCRRRRRPNFSGGCDMTWILQLWTEPSVAQCAGRLNRATKKILPVHVHRHHHHYHRLPPPPLLPRGVASDFCACFFCVNTGSGGWSSGRDICAGEGYPEGLTEPSGLGLGIEEATFSFKAPKMPLYWYLLQRPFYMRALYCAFLVAHTSHLASILTTHPRRTRPCRTRRRPRWIAPCANICIQIGALARMC
jgi:hypothetical protein